MHSYQASAVSLTQATESGTVYRPGEIASICEAAARRELAVQLDGARFGNAVAALGCHPADVTWRAGIQLLSFGASKNGCLSAEALVMFHDRLPAGRGLDPDSLRERAERLRKRSGHLLCKMCYVSAQLLAYIENGRWLDMAAHANAQAARFATAEPLGGSVFIAAFVAGIAIQKGFKEVDVECSRVCKKLGATLNLFVFFVFGIIAGPILREITWSLVLYAVLSLTVIRMLPVALSFNKTGLNRATVLFIGWFGPRGLASIGPWSHIFSPGG